MKNTFNIWMGLFFITLIIGVNTIKKYENLYIKNVEDSEIYFQNPSRLLLKVNYIFDEAIYELHKVEHHKGNLVKSKILLISAKNLLQNKSDYKDLLNIIKTLIYKIDTKQTINEDYFFKQFHQKVNKISFLEFQKSINYFDKYKQDIHQIQIVIYIIIAILSLLTIALLFISYQSNLLKKITYISQTDQLTQAYNRRRFFEEIKNETNYSLIMFDIDHFKAINDTYGHEKGDFVLQNLVKLIKKYIRKDDMIFRWGGEEFFILFKKMNIKEAKKMAEKLRKLVENYDFDGVNITISVSVITSKNSKEIKKIIKILDEGLYEAKNSGRNKVIIKGEI